VWTARARLGLASALCAQQRHAEALDLLRSAQAAFRRPARQAHAMRAVADLVREQGRHPAATALFHQSLDIFTELGDDAGAARAQYGLGEALRQAGQPAEPITWFDHCLPAFERLGYRHWRARVLHAYGAALAARGDRPAAAA
jgi:tetratricopeptide (TPR) repeat protein